MHEQGLGDRLGDPESREKVEGGTDDSNLHELAEYNGVAGFTHN